MILAHRLHLSIDIYTISRSYLQPNVLYPIGALKDYDCPDLLNDGELIDFQQDIQEGSLAYLFDIHPGLVYDQTHPDGSITQECLIQPVILVAANKPGEQPFEIPRKQFGIAPTLLAWIDDPALHSWDASRYSSSFNAADASRNGVRAPEGVANNVPELKPVAGKGIATIQPESKPPRTILKRVKPTLNSPLPNASTTKTNSERSGGEEVRYYGGASGEPAADFWTAIQSDGDPMDDVWEDISEDDDENENDPASPNRGLVYRGSRGRDNRGPRGQSDRGSRGRGIATSERGNRVGRGGGGRSRNEDPSSHSREYPVGGGRGARGRNSRRGEDRGRGYRVRGHSASGEEEPSSRGRGRGRGEKDDKGGDTGRGGRGHGYPKQGEQESNSRGRGNARGNRGSKAHDGQASTPSENNQVARRSHQSQNRKPVSSRGRGDTGQNNRGEGGGANQKPPSNKYGSLDPIHEI